MSVFRYTQVGRSGKEAGGHYWFSRSLRGERRLSGRAKEASSRRERVKQALSTFEGRVFALTVTGNKRWSNITKGEEEEEEKRGAGVREGGEETRV